MMSKTEEEEVLAYHKRCKAICAALGVELAGFTPGKALVYNIPEQRLQSSYGDHELPHLMVERIEKLIKKPE
jgi:hypothetical protein